MKFARTAVITIAAILVSPAHAEPYSTAQTKLSENGHYRITLRSVPDSPPIAQLHNWIVHVETAEGDEFVPTRLGIQGGMPAHGHGFDSQPQITEFLENGDFLIEGMKFHMGGDWLLVIGLAGPKGFDQAKFEFAISASLAPAEVTGATWTDAEIAILKTLSVDSLDAKLDPSNRFSGNQQAAELGRLLFFDKALSASGTVACANCHDPNRKFTDGMKKSIGLAETQRHAPSLIGVAHSQWFYWDGRRDSLWAQAITPIETAGEMGNTRTDAVKYVLGKYATEYRELTGIEFETDEIRFAKGAGPFASPAGKQAWNRMRASDRETINNAFSNIGKFLAAYVENLAPNRSRFDEFVAALDRQDLDSAANLMDNSEQSGLKLFLSDEKTQCLRCHNGPMFTNHGFHNIATGTSVDGKFDFGRMIGLQAALHDEFNCRGKYSDAPKDKCTALRFADSGHDSRGAFKVPGLRNVAATAPYMHDGRFSEMEDVLNFYNREPDPGIGPHELPTLDLSNEEITQLAAFLNTLTGHASVATP